MSEIQGNMEAEGIDFEKFCCWTRPQSLSYWSDVYDCDRKELAKRIKDKRIRAKKFSDRKWQIHYEDVPYEYLFNSAYSDFIKSGEKPKPEIQVVIYCGLLANTGKHCKFQNCTVRHIV